MKNFILAFFGLFLVISLATAQEDTPKDTANGFWENGAGIGLDFSQLLQINPKVGSGQNSVGAGGNINFFANYLKERLSWDNGVSWAFGVLKVGSGTLPSGANIPFQKTIDEVRLGSRLGFKTSDKSKFAYAADLGFQSLVATAYQDTSGVYSGVLLSDIEDTQPRTQQFAKFLSPATTTFSLGIDYKPSPGLSIFYSPASYKGIFVSDQAIADLNIHGNEEDKKTFHQLGSLLKLLLNQKLANDRVLYTSGLSLYSNYLKEPQNIDVDWQNQLDFAIVKNLAISLKLNLFYDHDVKVQISDSDAPDGVNGLGRRVSITQQLLLKYGITF